jgi:hypothetical protein
VRDALIGDRATLAAVDASTLRQTFEKLDACLQAPSDLVIRGGAALLALGF